MAASVSPVSTGGECLLVGVLNCTPDSFSDGGQLASPEAAIAAGVAMVEAGADWLDVGGESTRPRSTPVPADEEQRRVVPVIAGLAARRGTRGRTCSATHK